MSTVEHLRDLRHLDVETWGERVARARSRSGLSLKEAATRVSQVLPVSYSTLMRLESMPQPPTDLKRRIVAFLTLVAYGYDPQRFDLDPGDLPRWITPDALADLRVTQKPCFAVDAA